MEVIVGKNAGFCYGVEKAVNNVIEILKNNEEIYCLGEIVHNKNVVNDLESKGMITVEKLENVKGKTIIRAHGIPIETYQEAKRMNITLIDLTCPNVLKIHKMVEDYSKRGYYIILIGIHSHPEIIGTISYGGKNSTVIERQEDIKNAINMIKFLKINNVAVFGQTTFSVEKFNIIVENIKQELEGSKINIEVINTICNATNIRQKETDELSKKVDCMIIIGGKNSSNTRKLYEIATKNCKNVYLIENQEELPIASIKNHKTVGIMAGASTPKNNIDEVVSKLK